MDLLDILRSEAAKVPEGTHSIGLRSVIRHIEVGFSHLARGQSDRNTNAFTDTIYRTNQAFEGIVKEAYRVLASKNPDNKLTIYEIEKYLTENNVFTQRILNLFSNYRTDWRNPSTHDYNLDFDEAEAFLAIVSVSAFAKLMIDQIIEKLAYQTTLKDEDIARISSDDQMSKGYTLRDRIKFILMKFANYYLEKKESNFIESESQLIGTITGFIAAADSGIKISQEYQLRGRRWGRADLVAETNGETVVIETKMGRNINALTESGIDQLRTYADNKSGNISLILFIFSPDAESYSEIRASESGALSVDVIYPKFQGT